MRRDTPPIDNTKPNAVHAAWLERKRTFDALTGPFYSKDEQTEAVKNYKAASLEFERLRGDLLK